MSDFNTWWNSEGSGIRPLPSEDTEEFAKRITQIAWSNGEYARHEALMQLFTDPENQPTQHGTVTVEYMQREIAAERNKLAAWMIERGYATGHGDTMKQLLDELGTEIADRADPIRARGQA